MYVCGPTVYDVPHLGHGRTALTYDTIRRYFIWHGFKVTMASNITDIDDKIIARALEEDRSEPEVAIEFTAAYDLEMQRLEVLAPDSRPHATQFIPQMLEVITQLIEQGVAYAVPERGVYMSVEAVSGYGELAGRNTDQLLEDAGSRVEIDPYKRSPLDFALWRAAQEGEPAWETPWGRGRPGWHTECVAMSQAALGEGFDIHGGGDDLVFPHHQNEWAQAQALGQEFARYWVHSAMVNVGGKKMAKSVGNFTNLSEAIDEVGPRAVRMAVLQAHYRKAMEMDTASLKAAAAAVERIDAFARRVVAADATRDVDIEMVAEELAQFDALGDADATRPDYAQIMRRFAAVMDDDFATPTALDIAFSTMRMVNAALDRNDPDAGDNSAASSTVQAAQAVIDIFSVLGLTPVIGSEQGGEDGTASAGTVGTGAASASAADAGLAVPEIERLIADRKQARADKDFAKADTIRDELAAAGVVIEDTPAGATWRRA